VFAKSEILLIQCAFQSDVAPFWVRVLDADAADAADAADGRSWYFKTYLFQRFQHVCAAF
ncbi:hypothetical protein, partial [Metamycoplasma equirhinis]|uniref:hypothetical protein n=1 Tax=Metamycoplasma equirhinis TaxID=92402 RepID=UPI0027D3410A